jgi:hypothetical protein
MKKKLSLKQSSNSLKAFVVGIADALVCKSLELLKNAEYHQALRIRLV